MNNFDSRNARSILVTVLEMTANGKTVHIWYMKITKNCVNASDLKKKVVKHEFGEKCALCTMLWETEWQKGGVTERQSDRKTEWERDVVLLLCKVYIFLRIHVLPLFFKLLAFTQFLSYLHVSYMKSFPIGCHFQNRNQNWSSISRTKVIQDLAGIHLAETPCI